MKLLKVAIRILSVIIVVGVVLTAVFFRDNSVSETSFSSDVFLSEKSQQLHTSSFDDFELLSTSGFVELYFNKITSEIAVRELSENFIWRAMPDGALSSMLDMQVVSNTGTYNLNSQDNSVAYSSWSYDIRENGVDITYRVSPEAYKNFDSDDIVFEIKLCVELRDGSLFTDCEVKNLSQNKNCGISSLQILPGLCSFKNPDKKDFLLIPDGCGAVIYPALSKEAEAYETKVYGDDYSVKKTGLSSAVMGAYGIKKDNSAVAVIIDSAEEIATIKAVCDKSGFSSVYAAFDVYDYMTDKKMYISQNPYCDSISLCFKFLSGDNASYSEIASSCREQYIRNGSLPSADVESGESVPLYLTLTGAYKSGPYSPVTVEYTTFSQAYDILSRVKSKGVDNITVRYVGAMKSGSSSFYSSLGNKKDLKNLISFAQSQNISLFIDTNVITYSSFMAKFDFAAIKNMKKSTSAIVVNNSPDSKAENYAKLRFRKKADIGDFVAELIKTAEKYQLTGYCIGDGEFIVSDYSADNVSRSEMKQYISSQIPAFSNVGDVMVNKGNMYLIKNASSVINIPMSACYDESEFYVAVPFVQSVLHGRVIISGVPVNTCDDFKKAVLRCVEYGVCPSFTSVYADKNQANNVLFDNIVNDVVSSYEFIDDALRGLESERITAHSRVGEGVYLTTYGDTAKIYVNYNNKPVTVNGVTVEAESCLRID